VEEAKTNTVERRVRALINPMSTAFTRWWCHSAVRFTLTGYGPARRRALPRWQHDARDALGLASHRAEDKTRQMKARAAAIDELMASGPDDGVGGCD
jgi:hypothetical protein